MIPLTSKCARYLFWSRKRFNVCEGDNLKFLDNDITKNYIILFDWRICLFTIDGILTVNMLESFTDIFEFCPNWDMLLFDSNEWLLLDKFDWFGLLLNVYLFYYAFKCYIIFIIGWYYKFSILLFCP